MKQLRVGVIGVGHLGQHHARLYAALPDAVLSGVTDSNPERARQVGDRHRVPVFADRADLLSRVDAVSVAVPTSAHHEVVRACLEAGVHVLVEKPIAVTLAEARELVELARNRKLALQVGHVERFNPVMQAMRPHIGRPGFIECHRLSPFGERGTDVDVVLDLMIHDLDMILSFQPGPVEEIRAAGVPVLSSSVDIANARIAFTSGCVANLTASRVSTTRMRRLRLFQRDAYVSVDFQTRQGVIFRRVTEPGKQPTIDIEQVRGGEEEPLKLELDAFVHSAATGAPVAVSGEQGTAALALAHQVLEAIEVYLRRQNHVPGPLPAGDV
ncbi:MAG TPA: Gfo/Idh/MocA family oxidoreductase [Nitrospiraceae bacterium]|nr:Gfo/Idh/MocA family oxidoreductase [Nitrospiraceae bacterium]